MRKILAFMLPFVFALVVVGFLRKVVFGQESFLPTLAEFENALIEFPKPMFYDGIIKWVEPSWKMANWSNVTDMLSFFVVLGSFIQCIAAGLAIVLSAAVIWPIQILVWFLQVIGVTFVNESSSSDYVDSSVDVSSSVGFIPLQALNRGLRGVIQNFLTFSLH